MHIEYDKPRIKKQLLKYAKNNKITAKRMQSIKYAKNFCDLEIASNGRAHFLKGTHKGKFALDVEKKRNGRRIICKPSGSDLCEIEPGVFKKESITGLKIIKIDDYH